MTTGEDHQFNIKESPLSTFTFPRGTFQIVTMVTMKCHKTARLAFGGKFMLIRIATYSTSHGFKDVQNGPRRPIVSHDTTIPLLHCSALKFKARWLDLCR